jgi:hypothetical protein
MTKHIRWAKGKLRVRKCLVQSASGSSFLYCNTPVPHGTTPRAGDFEDLDAREQGEAAELLASMGIQSTPSSAHWTKNRNPMVHFSDYVIHLGVEDAPSTEGFSAAETVCGHRTLGDWRDGSLSSSLEAEHGVHNPSQTLSSCGSTLLCQCMSNKTKLTLTRPSTRRSLTRSCPGTVCAR